MGNRAMIVMEQGEGKTVERGPAIYLQWNGGAESVYAFLKELDNRKMRTGDVAYETARMIHVIGDFFDSDNTITTLSLGVMPYNMKTDKQIEKNAHWDLDNGVYLVNREKGTMRRYDVFTKTWYTEKCVKQEKNKALKDKKYTAILDDLANDRKDKIIED